MQKQKALTDSSLIEGDTKRLYIESNGKTVFGLYSPINADITKLLYSSAG